VEPLNRLGVPYMVTGSMASIFYGRPRMTHDLDLVLSVSPGSVDRMAAAFPAEAFYFPPAEVILVEAARPLRGHFNILHHATGFRADVYLAGRDPLHAWAMARRREGYLGEERVWFAPPEYVIVRKLEYFRESGHEKHVEDLRGMLAVSAAEIDLGELSRLIEKRGLQDGWQRVTG
jgi:hypothetical protein